LIGALLFTLAGTGAGLAGIIVSGGIATGGQKTACAMVSMLDTLVTGSPPDQWIGISPAVTKIEQVLSNFTNIINSLNNVGTNFTDLNNKLGLASTAITNMYTNRNGLTLPDPDPTNSGQTYIPDTISKLGPTATLSTITGSMKKEMDIKSDIVQTASTLLNSSIGSLKGQTQPIHDAIQSGVDMAKTIKDSVTGYLNDVGDYGDQANTGTNLTGTILLVIFVVVLVVSALALGSILLVKLCKLKLFNKLTHLTWCLLGLFMILGWILSTLLFPLSIVMVEACQVIDSFLTDPAFFNSSIATLMKGAADTTDTVYICLHGNGDILTKLGVKDQLGYFDTIFTQLDKAKDYFPSSQGTVPFSITIPINLDIVQKSKTGVYPDSTTIVDRLVSLTARTKASVSATCVTGIEDTWLLNSVNCTAGSFGTTFHNADGDVGGKPAATCIGLDEWTGRTIANRYLTANYPSCPQVNSVNQEVYVRSYVTNFLAHKTARTTLFGNLETDILDIQTKNNNFMTSLFAITSPFDAINTNIHQLYDALAHPTTGLLSNAKCSFIKTGLKNLYNAMCVGFISSIYQTSVCIIIVSTFAFFATFFVFCFAKRSIIAEDDEEK
jgi:hypothetical protein